MVTARPIMAVLVIATLVIALPRLAQADDHEDFDILWGFEPLPLSKAYDVWFDLACTGSMEPALTCLDRVLLRKKGYFLPSDIRVGTIIAYTLDPDLEDGVASDALGQDCTGAGTEDGGLHRVVAIEYKHGSYHYWTQGDGNVGPDRCWKPFRIVDAYVLDIARNANMANAPLRTALNASKRAYYSALDEARAALDEAGAAYDEAFSAYKKLLRRYCGGTDVCPSTHYTLIGEAYGRLNTLLDLFRDASTRHGAVSSDGYSLKVVFDCWWKNAIEATYPGHIPHECPSS